MQHLVWFDDDRKKPLASKIEGGRAAYQERLGTRPTVVLVNERDRVEVEGMRVEVLQTVQPCNFWLGQEGT